MNDLDEIRQQLLNFRKERNWEQFHNPKDIAISISLEASEVLEHFQWRDQKEVKEYVQKHKDEISEELADVFNWIILLSHDLDIDIVKAANKKIVKNAKKYPKDKAKDNHKKYTEL